MIWAAALLLAIIPHVGNPFAVSAIIFAAVVLIAYHFKMQFQQVLIQVTKNQQEIYKKIG